MKGESADSIKRRAFNRTQPHTRDPLPKPGSDLRALYDLLRSVAPHGIVPRPEDRTQADLYRMKVEALRTAYLCDIRTIYERGPQPTRGRPRIVGWRLVGEYVGKDYIAY